ncbi:MAG: S8/S53 family peptidase [Saprospiraceae bacterium]|nr:S8/S53 family peptidase [Candidatus Vicinibacter proximus]MBL7821983.1 S8/S53 family peptidase [Saprospiraceae bacterium]MCC6843218.1 S8/S53 family peptidase [Saprospiraceae bacterium]
MATEFRFNRNLVLIIIGLLTLTSIILTTFSCNNCDILNANGNSCSSVDTFRTAFDRIEKYPSFDTFPSYQKLKNDSFDLTYQCSQLILDPDHPRVKEIRDSLRKACFKLVKTCPCDPPFELWEYPGVGGVGSGTVVSNPIRQGGLGDGMLLNVVFNMPEPINSRDTISLSKDNWPNLNCQDASIQRTIEIAIVDSGVEENSGVPNPGSGTILGLQFFGWNSINNGNLCNPNSFQKGIDICLNTEPVDSHGHGSSVNAVSTGASLPNFKTNIPLRFVNVKITEGSTKYGNLFDALCGLNYALNQNPDIINISWGFKFVSSDANEQMDSALTKVFNNFIRKADQHDILIVAAIGNDSLYLNEDVKFYPASLAPRHDNFVSVGSLDKNGNDLAGFSNFADVNSGIVTINTFGKEITNAYPSRMQNTTIASGWVIQSGTSFSAPLVTRIAALRRYKYGETSVAFKNKLNLVNNSLSIRYNGLLEFKKYDIMVESSTICP